MPRTRYTALWLAYLLLCGSPAFTGTILKAAGFAPAPVELQPEQPAALKIPVARIQSIPDRDNLCRVLLLHNDSGHYQDGGRGQCTFPEDMLVWTARSRAEVFSEAFRSSWKGEPPGSSLR
jgi:hypothetical protein